MILEFLYKIENKIKLFYLRRKPNIHISNIKVGREPNFVFYDNLKIIKIGNNFSLRNYVQIIVQNNAQLQIGNNVFMNNYCSINTLESISIGDNTLFGEGVKLYDHNHDYDRTNNTLTVHHQKFNTSPIKIGNNCWLGSNVIILKGVNIGDNCIIGAGCIITKDIPANTTVINNQNLIIK